MSEGAAAGAVPVPPLRIVGGTVVTPTGVRRRDLVAHDGRITELVDAGAGPPLAGSGTTIDASGLIVAPGFLDLQVNGGAGVDVTSELGDDPGRLWQLGRHLPAQGVTAFVPTVVSSSGAAVSAALTALATRPTGYLGAEVLGVHAEGPMLAPARRGTHDPAALRTPDLALTAGWSRAAGLVMVTIAPELPGVLEVVRSLVARGVVVSVGHTDASYEQTLAALDAGARAGTHLGNAMSGWTARAPGAAGALLTDPRPVVGLIVDGVHLHPATVTAAWRLLGADRMLLVSDAIAAAGTGDGAAVLGSREVTVADGVVRDADGALAGSVVTLDRALRTLVATTGADLVDALATVTSTPSRLLGDPSRGRLVPGAQADVTVLTPELEVVATVVAGRMAAVPRPDLVEVRAPGH